MGSEAAKAVVTRAALSERSVEMKAWEFVPDLFGPGQGAFIRGYGQDELDQWRELATDGRGRIDAALLNAAEIAFCVAEDEAGTLLFRNPDAPTGLPAMGDLKAIKEGLVPPGLISRVVNRIDVKAGFQAVVDPTAVLRSGTILSPESTSSNGASTASDAGPVRSAPRPGGSGQPSDAT